MILQQIEEARKLATPVPQAITAVFTCPSFIIQHIPTLGTGGATAGVSAAGGEGALTFSVDSAVTAGADLVGTLGVLLMSGYSTIGDVQDKVNANPSWRMILVGALRADIPTAIVAKTGAVCGETGITFYHDSSSTYGTGGHQHFSTAISGEKFANKGVNGHVKDDDDECENTLHYMTFTGTFASPGATSVGQYIKYYSGKQGSTEVQMGGSVAITDATAKEQGEANVGDAWIRSKRGERLVIRMVCDCVGAVTAPTINIIGSTAVLKNDRIVDSIGYGDA